MIGCATLAPFLDVDMERGFIKRSPVAALAVTTMVAGVSAEDNKVDLRQSAFTLNLSAVFQAYSLPLIATSASCRV